MNTAAALPILTPFVSNNNDNDGRAEGPAAFADFLDKNHASCRTIKNKFFIRKHKINLLADNDRQNHCQILKLFHDAKANNTAPIFFGGDHSISFFIIKAITSVYPELALVVFDAHSDVQGEEEEIRCWNVLRKIKSITGNSLKLIHIGFRDIDETELREYADTVFPMHELVKTGYNDCAGRLKEAIAGRPVYVSIDLDVLDPSAFFAVSSPISGGLITQQLFFMIQSLAGEELAGADIVEYNHTAYDIKNMLLLVDLFYHLENICEHSNISG